MDKSCCIWLDLGCIWLDLGCICAVYCLHLAVYVLTDFIVGMHHARMRIARFGSLGDSTWYRKALKGLSRGLSKGLSRGIVWVFSLGRSRRPPRVSIPGGVGGSWTGFTSGTGEQRDSEDAYDAVGELRHGVELVSNACALLGWRHYAINDTNALSLLVSLEGLERKSEIQRLLRDNSIVSISDSPQLRMILGKGGSIFPGFNLRKLTFASIILTGRAYWVVKRSGEAIFVPASWVSKRPTVDDPFYKINNHDVPASLVFCFVDPSVPDPYMTMGFRGGGNVYSQADAVIGAEAGSGYLANWLNRGLYEPIIITASKQPESRGEGLKEGQNSLEKDHVFQDKKAMNVPVWIDDDKSVSHFTQHTHREMQLKELMDFTDQGLKRRLKIPPAISGSLESSSKDNLEAALTLFGDFCVRPRVVEFRDLLNHQLRILYGDTTWLEVNQPLATDSADFRLRAQRAAPALPRVDEWRSLQGLPFEKGTEIHLVRGKAFPVSDMSNPREYMQ